ncbi:MAG: HEAT repeat domain-containing protein [Bryobacterales bacterium]|nr:HEAT repeat domain-containing protein [Bryobacterales bacterium]
MFLRMSVKIILFLVAQVCLGQINAPRLAEVEERVLDALLIIEPPDSGILAVVKAAGPPDLVKAAVLKILDESYPVTQNKGMTLRRVIGVIGGLKFREAIPKIQLVLRDSALYQPTRASAARSLGRIDPEGSKQILIDAFDACTPLEFEVRIAIAEALAETRDRTVLAKLETWARGEPQGSFERRNFDRIVSAMRMKLQRN